MKIAVISLPRTGSTMVFRSICGLGPDNVSPPKRQDERKYHYINPSEIDKDTKVIFLFGDAILSVISTSIHRWDEQHFKNCNCDKFPLKKEVIFNEDLLNYEKIFDIWSKDTGHNKICMRYETIFKNKHYLDAFLDKKIQFPDKSKRTTKYDDISEAHLHEIKFTYNGLINKIKYMPDVCIFGGGK